MPVIFNGANSHLDRGSFIEAMAKANPAGFRRPKKVGKPDRSEGKKWFRLSHREGVKSDQAAGLEVQLIRQQAGR